ncbi:hypothetical protein P4H83_06740 [Paenibacillus favisporus]|uniref:hypothetical protein n=1 Tax=Paenibacillus favisporus TaxID=221028 RepID=UPI002DB63E7D|nr:hypothetical protein [Paenibacillus favisporus]MEC0174567.1 hypothetical protein [Paenibacillus favisporus]
MLNQPDNKKIGQYGGYDNWDKNQCEVISEKSTKQQSAIRLPDTVYHDNPPNKIS